MKTQHKSPSVTIVCDRCGYKFELSERTIARRGPSELCQSCTSKPTKIVTYNGFTCYPWQGEFDLENNVALLNGKPHLVGLRSCGNADCMNRNHVIPNTQPKKKEPYPKPKPPRKMEPSTGIFRGEVITYDRLLADIKKNKC
jgi:hypothetical protein